MNALQRLSILALAGFAACWLPVSALAFSSAENAAHHQPAQHLGYVAFAAEGKLEALKAVPRPENAEAMLWMNGLGSLHTFSASLDDRTVLFSRHISPNGACVSNAWKGAMADETLGPWFKAQGNFVEAHPRAAAMGMAWLPMEQVFYHAGPERKPGKEARACAAITGLKPEMEMQYRTLHQTGWPGMLAAMDRANVNHFTLYLVDIGEKLYLFYYFDYVGDDFAADMAGMAKDPVTQRWWKHTDPCQIPLPGAKGIWTDMVPVGAAAKAFVAPAKVDAAETKKQAATCTLYLRQINANTQQYLLEMGTTKVPSPGEIAIMWQSGKFPVCPSGGKYTLPKTADGLPTCSHPGHSLLP